MSISTAAKVLTVSELTQAIKAHLEPKFFHVCIKGEITNFTAQASGHLYFNLKDENSQIACVVFKNTASTLSQPLKAGDKVMIKGSLSLYVPRGSYQIIVSHVQQEGVGDLLIKLHQLKEKLQKKGYFDAERKKPLPKYPKTIGVVTSPTGAVIHDILNVLQRRFKGFHLILNPVKVQGEGAEREIAEAIHDFNKFNLVDVIIVGRGGGSLEDLWAFNEECVVEAIYNSKIPIISSVGHETDFSLSDFVADVRAPTPSAAAELAIKEKSIQIEFLEKARKICHSSLINCLTQHKLKLKAITRQRLFVSSDAFLGAYYQKIDTLSNHLQALRPDRQIEALKEKNRNFCQHLDKQIQTLLEKKKTSLHHLQQLIEALNPSALLKKGYCIPFAEKLDSVIISAKQVKPGDSLVLQFHDGKVSTIVTKDKEL